eukprot:2230170-Heterocapsa_arctica.AAC.1
MHEFDPMALATLLLGPSAGSRPGGKFRPRRHGLAARRRGLHPCDHPTLPNPFLSPHRSG